eukprot:TCONS_00042612-protein
MHLCKVFSLQIILQEHSSSPDPEPSCSKKTTIFCSLPTRILPFDIVFSTKFVYKSAGIFRKNHRPFSKVGKGKDEIKKSAKLISSVNTDSIRRETYYVL